MLDDLHDDDECRRGPNDELCVGHGNELHACLSLGHRHDCAEADHDHGLEYDPHVWRCRTNDHADLHPRQRADLHSPVRPAGLLYGLYDDDDRRRDSH